MNPPANPIDAANKMAKVYTDYARQAAAPGAGPATLTGAETAAMANVLVGGFNPLGAASAAAGGLVGGITTFWLAPPVVFGAGVVVAWPGPPALGSCLNSSFTNPKIPAGAAAAKLANCFDSATRLVLVQPPAPVPPVPIF
jgi:hypothetical protein